MSILEQLQYFDAHLRFDLKVPTKCQLEKTARRIESLVDTLPAAPEHIPQQLIDSALSALQAQIPSSLSNKEIRVFCIAGLSQVENVENPDFAISLLTKLKEEQKLRRIEKEKNQELALQIEIEKPLTDFGRAISQSKASVSVGIFAKTIEKELSIKFGRNKCFKWLRGNSFLMSKESNKNQPYQKWIDQGIFEVVQGLRQNSTFQKIDTTTLVTGKGQEYLFDKILKDLSMLDLIKDK